MEKYIRSAAPMWEKVWVSPAMANQPTKKLELFAIPMQTFSITGEI
jgi:hypothetical protein